MTALAPEVTAALPTFFVVGAPKAGTTSLHTYLGTHPGIAVSKVKEPMCFARSNWVDRMAEYRGLFEDSAAVRGESSTAYSSYPFAPEVPDRVRATVPEARIIYVVRDPIERTLSHYAQNVWDGYALRSFDELVEDLEDPMNMPVWCSRYATQLERWLERFGLGRLLVLDHRDLLANRARALSEVFAFLEVDPDFSSPEWEREHNLATSHRVPNAIGRRLGLDRERAMRMRGPGRLLTYEIPSPTLTSEQRARLSSFLAPEAERLRRLSGLSLSHWSV